MTTVAISNVNSLADLTNVVNAKPQTEGASNFSDMLKASSEKQNSIADSQPKTADEAKKTKRDLETNVSDNKPETEIDDKAAEVADKAQNADAKDETEIDDEITDEVMAAAAQAMNAVAQILDVPVEVVEEAIESLDLSEVDILDGTKIQDIALAATKTDDPVALMTDEDLYADVKAATEVVGEIVEDLDLPEDALKDAIAKISEESQAQASEIKITNTDETQKKDTNAGNQSEAGAFGWQESVIEGIKEAAGEINETQSTQFSDMEQIYEQVSEGLKLNMAKDVTEMEINLHPASLGNVKIQIAAKDGVITANFTTQNEQVKAAIESPIKKLEDKLNCP